MEKFVNNGANAGAIARKGLEAGATGAKAAGWFLKGFWQGLTAKPEVEAEVEMVEVKRVPAKRAPVKRATVRKAK
jgi:hypothetical protein